MKIRQWISQWEEKVPLSLQEDWDHSGGQLGDLDQELSGIVFTLDLTDEAIEQALAHGANFIFTHHPLFFQPLPDLLGDRPLKRRILRACAHQLVVYSAHTPFDGIDGGVNDVLADLLGLKKCQPLEVWNERTGAAGLAEGMGRIGFLEGEPSLSSYASFLKKQFQAPSIVFYGPAEKKISCVACVGGSGLSYADLALEKGADLFVTADLTYHKLQEPLENGLALVDLGHDTSEEPALLQAERWSQAIAPSTPTYRLGPCPIFRRQVV